MGGQVPNNLAIRLHRAGVRILGTSAESIDMAEDRHKFSALLDQLGIDQPRWEHVTDASDAERIVERLGGYPVLVRPSYVLSGAAMSVAHEPNELSRILARAKAVSPEHPVVISKFETHAREMEIDAVADGGEIVLWAISEHIEDAGVHSGDATLVLPPQTLYIATIRRRQQDRRRRWPRRCGSPARSTCSSWPSTTTVKVIECNLRASRSFPFVSKVTGNNFVVEAMRRMLGVAARRWRTTPSTSTTWRSRRPCSPSRGWWAPTRCSAWRWPHRRGRLLRRRPARGAAARAARDGLHGSRRRACCCRWAP